MKDLVLNNFKSFFGKNLTKVVILVIIYVFLMDADPTIPYLNLITESWEARVTVVFILGMFFFKPNAVVILRSILFLFIVYGILIFIFGQRGFDIFGLIIYVLLVFLLFKLNTIK